MNHMNKQSFRGRWPTKKGRNTYINILKLETVWMACQRFKELMKGKTISFQIENTTTVAYLLREGELIARPSNVLLRRSCSNVTRMG